LQIPLQFIAECSSETIIMTCLHLPRYRKNNYSGMFFAAYDEDKYSRRKNK